LSDINFWVKIWRLIYFWANITRLTVHRGEHFASDKKSCPAPSDQYSEMQG